MSASVFNHVRIGVNRGNVDIGGDIHLWTHDHRASLLRNGQGRIRGVGTERAEEEGDDKWMTIIQNASHVQSVNREKKRNE